MIQERTIYGVALALGVSACAGAVYAMLHHLAHGRVASGLFFALVLAYVLLIARSIWRARSTGTRITAQQPPLMRAMSVSIVVLLFLILAL